VRQIPQHCFDRLGIGPGSRPGDDDTAHQRCISARNWL
jgi:hypothetical protein